MASNNTNRGTNSMETILTFENRNVVCTIMHIPVSKSKNLEHVPLNIFVISMLPTYEYVVGFDG